MKAAAARFFVATDGNDAWSGRLPRPNAAGTDGPFTTPGRARDAIRELKSPEGLQQPVEVLIAGGTYHLFEPLVLGPEDSGTEQCPITYAAYGRKRPILSGGRPITGWQRGPGKTWTVELPEVREGKSYFHQLFVNGRRRSRPRFPHEGRLSITPLNAEDKEAPENKGAFRFNAGDIRSNWTNLDDVEVVVLQVWMEARLRIQAIDEATNTVRFTGRSWRPLNWTTGYYVENVAEELQPGQWYLNRSTGVLTYWPMAGERPATGEVIAPACRQLLRIEGRPSEGKFVRHVTLRGVSFQYTSWTWPREGCAITQAEITAPAAVHATGALHCTFEDCDFAHLGGWAISLGCGCRGNRIIRSRFHDLGAGGVKIGEPTQAKPRAEATGGNVISNNDLRDGSLVYLGAAAIWIGLAGDNVVSHNEIQGPFQWAVSIGWNWTYWPPTPAGRNIIEFNHCHHLGTGELGMHGALYALGVQPGTAFRNNLVHDVHHWPKVTTVASGCGIFLDTACAGITVENNVVYRCDGGGLCTNFNVMGNIIQNNIFAMGRFAQLSRYGDPAPPGEWMPNPIIFRNNIVYWDDGRMFWDEDWPNFAVLWDYNLYYDCRGPFNIMKYTLDEWQAKGLDRNSIVADPIFRDPRHGDFTLDPASPAIALGFRPIELPGG